MFRKSTLSIFIATVIVSSCVDHEFKDGCTHRATVRDLTGFDGCGIILELKDGTRLEPRFDVPLNSVELVDGKKVVISYVAEPAPSICMVGIGARVTCIREE